MPARETISLEDAERAIGAAMAAARPNERPFALAVVDESGALVYSVRRDGASATDVRNAERKAYTAAFIGRDTLIYRQQISHDGAHRRRLVERRRHDAARRADAAPGERGHRRHRRERHRRRGPR